VAQKLAIMRPIEVDKLLGIRRSRVYALPRKGVLPPVRIAGAIWIPRPAFEECLLELSARAIAATRTPEAADADR
jgi:hypothetical protein